MQIRLSTSDYEASKLVLQPLSDSAPTATEREQPEITWGQVSVRPGVVEALFEIVGVVGIGVSSGVLANWIWSLVRARPEMNEIRIEVQKPDGHRVLIEGRSPDAIKVELKNLFDSKQATQHTRKDA